MADTTVTAQIKREYARTLEVMGRRLLSAAPGHGNVGMRLGFQFEAEEGIYNMVDDGTGDSPLAVY